MTATKTQAATMTKTEKLMAKNYKTELADIASNVLCLIAPGTAKDMNSAELTERIGQDGFTEEGLLEDLIDRFEMHPTQVNDLCLCSMVQLWLEFVQPQLAEKAKPAKAAKVKQVKAPKGKAAKLAKFATASELFGQKVGAVIAARSRAAKAAREQDLTDVPAFNRKYGEWGTGPLDIVRAMVGSGVFTKAEIRAEVLRNHPAIRASYLNTMLTRLTSRTNPILKQDVVVLESGRIAYA